MCTCKPSGRGCAVAVSLARALGVGGMGVCALGPLWMCGWRQVLGVCRAVVWERVPLLADGVGVCVLAGV